MECYQVNVVKCLECGNPFKIADSIMDGELIHCPACEADYKVVIKNGKVTIEESNYGDKDLGEL